MILACPVPRPSAGLATMQATAHGRGFRHPHGRHGPCSAKESSATGAVFFSDQFKLGIEASDTWAPGTYDGRSTAETSTAWSSWRTGCSRPRGAA
jgi:hypothetical protein